MATVNKNFKIKSGLVVEGTTGTINGFNILTENQASEDYIVGIVGGTTLVTSVESTQMEVVAGELNIKSGVFDASGAAAAAQSAAATDATTKANNAKSGAEATASADATAKANAAQSAAEATASSDATSKANAARTAAEATAAADATTKANNAKSGAEATAAADATSKANAAQASAEATAALDATAKANAAKSGAEATAALDATAKADAALVAANAYTDAEVALLVNGAPDLLNTLNELAEAIGENPNYAVDLAASVGEKVAKAGDTMTGALTLSGAPTSSLHAATKSYVDSAQAAAEATASADATTKADAAEAAALVGAALDATTKANAVAGDLTDHENATAAHGATGAVVGTTNTQTLTNKTIGDTLNFTGAGAMTINSDSHIVLTPAAGSSVKWGSDVLATQAYVDDQTTDTIAEAGNLYFTNARAIAAVGGTIGDAINDIDTDDIEEGLTNLYFTNGRAVSATAASYDVLGAAAAADTSARGYADGLAVNYDAAGSANTAYSDAVAAAATDATTKANNAKSGAEATASADATSKANAAKSGAEATAAAALSTAISTEVTDRNSAISSAIATEVTNRDAAIGTAVSSLVDGAPALLDTLNELALALGDSPSTVTDLTTLVGTKAPLASPALTGVPTAPTAAADTNTTQIATTAFAKAEADAAQTAAEATASTDATGKANAAQAAAEATAQAALDDVLDATTAFTALNVNDEAKHIAASSSGTATVVATAFEWAKADYRSAKLLVKIDNGTHNELSEILVTLDSTDNIAITEYAIVGTNGSRGTVTADVSGSNVRIRVTPVNNSTVKVTGTLLK
jgi:hypothetical protein